MRILPSYNCISITAWLHSLDSNKMIREKVRWELPMEAAYCIE